MLQCHFCYSAASATVRGRQWLNKGEVMTYGHNEGAKAAMKAD